MHLFPNKVSCSPLMIANRHAGRTVVTTDDVMMLARKNVGLKDILQQAAPQKGGP